MNDQLVKRAYLLGKFDTLCESGVKFPSEEMKKKAQEAFVETGGLKLAYMDPMQAQQLMGMQGAPGGAPMDMGMGAPPVTQEGGSPAPMPPSDPAAGGQANPSGGEVLLIGGQITNSDIKAFEKILNILKGLKMQYDEQAGMGASADAGASAGAAAGAPAGGAPAAPQAGGY
jgi:hypothetical protein